MAAKLAWPYRSPAGSFALALEPLASTFGAFVTTYTLYVRDGRYAVPTLLTIEARDDEAARADARQYLGRSPHYSAVEIWDDERKVDELRLGET